MKVIGFYVRKKKVYEINLTEKDLSNIILCVAPAPIYFMTVPGAVNSLQAIACMTTITDKLMPIINVIKDCAKPVAYGSMCWGWCKVMLGHKSEGYKQIHNAAWGFLGVQFVPMIMDIISNLGGGVNG